MGFCEIIEIFHARQWYKKRASEAASFSLRPRSRRTHVGIDDIVRNGQTLRTHQGGQ
jgi:hypothetical protein